MKKKVCLLFATFLALTATGCSSNEASSNASEIDTEKAFAPSLDINTECTIKINGHYSNFEALDEQIANFKKFYSKVNIVYELVQNYAKEDTIKELFASSNSPEIFFVNNSWENDSRYTTIFENAEDLADESTGINLSVIRDELIYKDKDGHVPFVPIYTNAFGMIVNEKIFADNGLSIPKTYDELIQVGETLKTKGYESPIKSPKGSLYSFYFPYFLSTINNNQEAVNALNSLNANAGTYLRSALEKTADFMSHNIFNREKCAEEITKDDNGTVRSLLFKGETPIIFTEVNRISSSTKYEAESEDYAAAGKFKYSFQPIPTVNNSGYYYNTLTLAFGVNKNKPKEILDMSNEFMRFLISSQNLNEMNKSKTQVSPAKKLGDDPKLDSFKEVVANDRMLYNYKIGLSANADIQARKAFEAYLGGASIDDAIAGYGSY